MKLRSLFLAPSIIVSVFLAGCSGEGDQAGESAETSANGQSVREITAEAQLQPTEGNTTRGTITFSSTEGGIRVVANIQGLPPGPHGFHIHEFGDCSSTDASSAGDHFNPTSHPHGAPEDSLRHVGDLGNIIVGSDSTAHYERVDPLLALEGPHSIVGKAVVVHANPDDLTSQPSGNAGARMACGVIVASERQVSR